MPSTLEGLAVILLGIVPGYIAATVWYRRRTWRGWGGQLDFIVRAIAASLAVQLTAILITLRWIYPVRADLANHPLRVGAWLAIVFLAIPVMGGAVGRWLSSAIFEPPRNERSWAVRVVSLLGAPIRKIWPPDPIGVFDYLFESGVADGRFLVVKYADGTWLAGTFGKGSWASTSPHPQGLFLAEEWLVTPEGHPYSRRPGSKGIALLDMTSVRSMHLLSSTNDEDLPK